MLRLLPWSSGLAAAKIAPQEVHYFAPPRQSSPNIELQKSPTLKRKRVSSAEIDLSTGPRKRRMEKTPPVFLRTNALAKEVSLSALPPLINERSAHSHSCSETQPQHGPGKMDTVPSTTNPKNEDESCPDQPATVRTKPDEETLRQILDSQISLEILLKHNELRLIDQEMAKCQISLEQLRRCTEIPYPMTRSSESVSQGQGPAVRSSRSAVEPESPAPWGVTDGPYTRHYAKWLLPDPLFDGGDLPEKTGLNTPTGQTPTKGRSTRGSFADPSTAAGKSKAQRASMFQALSSGYPQPKEKIGPMTQKRKSDGLLVKLVCLDCRRDNFSSAQGFINHCRIAHGRSFASHDAAADACGEPVDVDEAGAVIGGEGASSGPTAGLVHPLIYTAHLVKQELPSKTFDTGSNAVRDTTLNALQPDTDVATTTEPSPNSHLTPSPLTPNLSIMMQRQGANLDLQSLVADMKTSIPLNEASESEGEGEDDEDAHMPDAPPLGRHPHRSGSMQPARSITSGQRDASSSCRKGLKNPRMLQRSTGQPLLPPAHVPAKSITPFPYVPPSHGDSLEPSPTNDSNQAPSLVDDDGDEEYEAHSPSYSASGSVDTENRDLDFAVEDGDESGPSTQNRSSEAEYSGTPKDHAAPAPPRRASAFRRSISGREEKHVSFVSPSPGREAEPSKRGGERKRKRTGGYQ